MTDPRDDLITTVARSLVARDPRPMPARVVARLPGRHAWSGWMSYPRSGVVVASAAALVALAATWISGPVSIPAVTPSSWPSPALALRAELPAPIEPTFVPRAASSAARRVDAAPYPADSAAEIAWRADAVPALAPPVALAVSVSQPEPVTIALLEVPELIAPRVTVSPLDPARWQRGR